MKLGGLTLFFPCWNEEGNVEAVVRDAIAAAPAVAEDFEVLIIDDGSSDGTAGKIRELIAAGLPVRLLQHPVNRGYGEALKTGFLSARQPWVFFSDGDSQFDLKELPRLTELTADADIVTGFRTHRADPAYRLLNQKIFGWASRLFLGVRVRDINCAFKLIRREVLEAIPLRSSGALINAELLAKARARGLRIAETGVHHRPRQRGSPTGARLDVIARALREFWLIYRELHWAGKHGAGGRI